MGRFARRVTGCGECRARASGQIKYIASGHFWITGEASWRLFRPVTLRNPP
jgi:hypothetical protein